jgi:hypothetical protein
MKLRLCRGLSRYSGNALYTNPAALYEGFTRREFWKAPNA